MSLFGRQTVDAAERMDEPDPDGWLRLRLRLDWPSEVPAMLVGIGSQMEVLDPPEVRESVAAMARAVAERYRESVETNA